MAAARAKPDGPGRAADTLLTVAPNGDTFVAESCAGRASEFSARTPTRENICNRRAAFVVLV